MHKFVLGTALTIYKTLSGTLGIRLLGLCQAEQIPCRQRGEVSSGQNMTVLPQYHIRLTSQSRLEGRHCRPDRRRFPRDSIHRQQEQDELRNSNTITWCSGQMSEPCPARHGPRASMIAWHHLRQDPMAWTPRGLK